MTSWSGPQKIYKSGQITFPADILRAAGLTRDLDHVRLAVNPDDPRTLIVVPESLFESWVEKGRRADAGLDP